MAEMMKYSQPLRAIGQALEVLDIQDFEMEAAGDAFYIRGNVLLMANKEIVSDQCSADELRAIWGASPSHGDQLRDNQRRTHAGPRSRVDLRYTVQDVTRLEEEGRSRRGNSEKTADASSLSQVLRCIGIYLNQKRASLCKISREIESFVIEYETSLGSRIKETLAVKDLYDLWVRLYVQRADRASY